MKILCLLAHTIHTRLGSKFSPTFRHVWDLDPVKASKPSLCFSHKLLCWVIKAFWDNDYNADNILLLLHNPLFHFLFCFININMHVIMSQQDHMNDLPNRSLNGKDKQSSPRRPNSMRHHDLRVRTATWPLSSSDGPWALYYLAYWKPVSLAMKIIHYHNF